MNLVKNKPTLNIFSGYFSATSSISIPPSGLATMTGPFDSLSIKIAKYVSLAMSNAWATVIYEVKFYCIITKKKLCMLKKGLQNPRLFTFTTVG